jgi:hypothetical protein
LLATLLPLWPMRYSRLTPVCLARKALRSQKRCHAYASKRIMPVDLSIAFFNPKQRITRRERIVYEIP